MSAAFLAGVVAGYGVAVPVGAIAVLIAGLTARTSLKVGAAAGMGAATADGLYALVAVLGGAALAAAVTPIATPLRWVAAVVLLLLAMHTARSAFRKTAPPAPATLADLPGPGIAERPDSTTPGRAYLGILGLTLLNPLTIVYFAALVLGRGGDDGGVWFVVGAFLASASWQLLIAAGGALVGRFLTGDRGRLVTALVSSAVIGILAVALVV